MTETVLYKQRMYSTFIPVHMQAVQTYIAPSLTSVLVCCCCCLFAAVPSSSGVPVTGAAAGSSTTVLLLQLLTQVINMTLGDDVIQHIPHKQQQQQEMAAESSISSVSTAAEAMTMLEHLSLQAAAGSTVQEQQQAGSDKQSVNGTHSSSAAAQEGSLSAQQQQHQQQPRADRDFTVVLDADWLASSSSKVQAFLAMMLPRLMAHPQPAVRAAVAAAAADLLQHCNRALQNSRQALIEILLTLANDDYEQVSRVAINSLQQCGAAAVSIQASDMAVLDTAKAVAAAAAPLSKSTAAGRIAAAARLALAGQDPSRSSVARDPTASSSSSSVLSDLAVRLCCELPAAVRRGDATGTAAAKRAAAALLCAGGGGHCA